ncbi:MAG: cytochrome c [Verrucomicrobiales bacterium]
MREILTEHRFSLTTVLVFILVATVAQVAVAGEEKRGKALFALCGACHGPQAHGNESIKAPALAGLTETYIADQLRKFQNGTRGAHPEDHTGLLMRPMSKTLANDEDIASVAAYIATLEPARPRITVEGNLAAGQPMYAVCVACHGDNLQGNPELKTPPLRHLNDWYMLAQLKKFKAGYRGTDIADIQSTQMRAIMGAVPDEAAMKNIIAYMNKMAAEQAD